MNKLTAFLMRFKEPSSAAGAAAVLGNVAGLIGGSISAAVALPAVFLGVLAVCLPESAGKTSEIGENHE